MKPTIELLIGAPLSGSEAVFLRQLCTDLSAVAGEFLILANFEVPPSATSSRQIDFIVVGPQRAELIELKAITGPIAGGENGPWRVINFSGKTIDYDGDNPWNQARMAKLRLNDAMRTYQKRNLTIPGPRRSHFFDFDSCVCVYPKLDDRSRVTRGNYKAWVRSYPELVSALINRPLPSNWTINEWRTFAVDYLGLRPSSLKGATDPSVAKNEEIIEHYETSLRELVSSGLGGLLTASPGEMCGELVVETLLGSENYLLIGRSGLGKSHHLKHLVIQTIGSNQVPILVDARHYRGDFGKALAKSLSPCTKVQPGALLDAVRIVGRNSVLLVDGLNYCRSTLSEDLARDLLSFQVQFGARIVATSQFTPEFPGGLVFKIVKLAELEQNHKRQIFLFHAGPTSTASGDLLQGFSTAYSVTMAARTFKADKPWATAADLYDNYVSQVSPPGFVSSSIAFFRECAFLMDEEIAYSVDRDRVERLLEVFVNRGQLSLALLDKIHDCPLLVFSGDLVHFEHDLLRDYFVAEALRRRCKDTRELADELKRPKYQRLVQFVCARSHSAPDLRMLLRSAQSRLALSEAIKGNLGVLAQNVVLKDISEFFSAAVADLPNISLLYQVFERENQKPLATWPTVTGERSWSSLEEILPSVVAENLENPVIANLFLDLVDMTEWALRKSSRSMAELLHVGPRGAWAEVLRVFRFQSSVFNVPALQMLSFLRTATRPGIRLSQFVIEGLYARLDTSDFCLLVLLNWASSCETVDADACILLFVKATERKLNFFLSEGLMMLRFAASRIRNKYPECIPKIVSLLQDVPSQDLFTNPLLMEALSAYDALQPPVTADDALVEMRSVVEQSHLESDLRELAQQANSLVGKIFEEIFQNVYYDSYNELSRAEKVDLLSLAAMGEFGLFTDWILHELLDLGEPRSLAIFQHFASGISAQTSTPQETIAAFLLGIAGCAKFGADLPAWEPATSDHSLVAWKLVSKIVHGVLSKKVLSQPEELAVIWERLNNQAPFAVADVLFQIESSGFNIGELSSQIDLLRLFPDAARELLEFSLLNRARLESVFPWRGSKDPELTNFILKCLGRIKSPKSLEVLKTVVEDPQIGYNAVTVIQAISAANHTYA